MEGEGHSDRQGGNCVTPRGDCRPYCLCRLWEELLAMLVNGRYCKIITHAHTHILEHMHRTSQLSRSTYSTRLDRVGNCKKIGQNQETDYYFYISTKIGEVKQTY